MMVYSREAFTSLYGKVLAMFQSIQAGKFDPDLAAPDRILAVAAAETPVPATPRPDSVVPSLAHQGNLTPPSSDSEASSGHSSLASDFEQATKPARGPAAEDAQILIHRVSGVAHYPDPSRHGAVTLCGRKVTANYTAPKRVSLDDGETECCLVCGSARGKQRGDRPQGPRDIRVRRGSILRVRFQTCH